MSNSNEYAGSRRSLRSWYGWLSASGFYLLVIAILLAFIFPFIWMVLASLKTRADILSTDHLFIFKPTLDNYVDVLAKNQDFAFYLMNSLIVGLGATCAALLLGLPASYAIAKYRLNLLGAVVLIVKIIPIITFLIPWYMIFSSLHMIDTYGVLILSHMLIALPYIIWIMIPFFKSLPGEIEESGLIDGCTQSRVFVKIVLPLAVPGIMTSALLGFIHSWNNFMFSLVLSGEKTKTLPVAVFNFMSDVEVNWGGVMTAAFLITLPVIVVSLVSQRYVVDGLSAGAVKG